MNFKTTGQLFTVLLLTAAFFVQCKDKGPQSTKMEEAPALVNTQAKAEEQCRKEIEEQRVYLQKETFSARYRFDDFPSADRMSSATRRLDPSSSVFARVFRTKLNEQVDTTPVNFNGHYSIVSVGMTGWGENYWIVDRTNGKSYEFPYYALSLDYRKESNLIIMNSKEQILKLLDDNKEHGCFFYNQQKVTDFRPFYFKWEGSELKLLAPNDIEPTVNAFWIEYTNDIPEGTPEADHQFIREAKEKVIRTLNKVPQWEGYTGFALLKAFPGMLPQDFDGVETPYGGYRIINGVLHFEGNAPSNAAALTVQGWQKLLQNLSIRLKRNIKTREETDSILSIITKRD